MKLHLDPPVDEWCKRLAQWLARADRPPHTPIRIATGHQPWFWHPGILAKYMATNALADAVGGVAIDIVVDQDTRESMAVACPTVRDGSIQVDSVEPIGCDPTVPLGMQPATSIGNLKPPADSKIEKLDSVRKPSLVWVGQASRLSCYPMTGETPVPPGVFGRSLVEALASFDSTTDRSLADQIHFANAQMMAALDVNMQRSIRASSLLSDDAGRAIVEAMLTDAVRCVDSYNAAVDAVPAAGMTKLTAARDRVELPLWSLRINEPRQRVFADLADSIPCLTLEDGSELTSADTLAPRALLLTAVMRSLHCDLFIHGIGGGVYDAITEAWWHAWRGETLAPCVVVSADVLLEFEGAPIADHSDHERAVWFAHHLPHNLDRYLPHGAPVDAISEQKEALLNQIAEQPDRKERSKLFQALHDINQQLANENEDVIQLASQQVERTRNGIENRRLAQRRDWSFALYPPAAMSELKSQIDQQIQAAFESAPFLNSS